MTLTTAVVRGSCCTPPSLQRLAFRSRHANKRFWAQIWALILAEPCGLRVVTAGLCILALAIQYGLTAGAEIGILQSTCRFLCYFTYWMNGVGALSMLAPVLAPRSALSQFFSRRDVRATVVTNLLVVGIVFHFILNEGFEWSVGYLADVLLHYVTPVLCLIDWLAHGRRGSLVWRRAGTCLLPPVGYGVWTLAFGAATHWSPYSFLETKTLAYGEIATNIVALLCLFLLAALSLVAIDRNMASSTIAAAT